MRTCNWETSNDPSVRRGAPLYFFQSVVDHGITEEVANDLLQVRDGGGAGILDCHGCHP
jgi:hypothetical protein